MNSETKALAKAKEQGLSAVVNRLFATKTPNQFIKTRPGPNGNTVKYVQIGYVTNELNKAFGIFWEFKVVDKQIGKKQVWVQGQLTIKEPKTGFSITKESFGGADIKYPKGGGDAIDIANDLKAAVSDCTKKCASMFGIAADVFFKEQDQYDQMDTVIDVEAGTDQSIYRIVTNKYFAIAADRGFTAEQAKEKVKTAFNVESMNDLTTQKIEQAIGLMEKNYEAVGSGETPRKIGAASIHNEESPITSPTTPDPTAIAELEQEVREDEKFNYPCRGIKHEGMEEEDKPKLPVGEFCSPECRDSYYPPEGKSKLDIMLENRKK